MPITRSDEPAFRQAGNLVFTFEMKNEISHSTLWVFVRNDNDIIFEDNTIFYFSL